MVDSLLSPIHVACFVEIIISIVFNNYRKVLLTMDAFTKYINPAAATRHRRAPCGRRPRGRHPPHPLRGHHQSRRLEAPTRLSLLLWYAMKSGSFNKKAVKHKLEDDHLRNTIEGVPRG